MQLSAFQSLEQPITSSEAAWLRGGACARFPAVRLEDLTVNLTNGKLAFSNGVAGAVLAWVGTRGRGGEADDGVAGLVGGFSSRGSGEGLDSGCHGAVHTRSFTLIWG